MKTPSTEFILIRTTRTQQPITVHMVADFGRGFDLSGYSFWRMAPSAAMAVEEWVPTDELHLYQNARQS